MLFINFLDFGTTIIEKEDLIVGLALLAHDGSTYLTESDTMSPAFAVQDETVALLLYVESRTVEMSLTEGSAYFELFADGECLLGADNLQFPDTAALASGYGNEIGNLAKILLQLASDEF